MTALSALLAAIAVAVAGPASAGALPNHDRRLARPARGQRHRLVRHRVLYVRATAPPGGGGSRQHPLNTLAAVERDSRAGDTVVVLPSPRPLDGGIALKPRQRLIGAGPPVTRRAPADVAWIENSRSDSHHGDAVELADGATVANLLVGRSRRGGIYGSNVTGVTVRGNDLSATNSSCTTGFVVAPFVLPTTAPGVGAPFSSGLPNGWAAIMIDASRGLTRALITDNAVHDADCADGIDVRASGTARMSVRVVHNTLSHLHQGANEQSVLAIGMQSTGTASLTAQVDKNTEAYIGNATVGDEGFADSEGLFANSAGHSRLIEHADHNTFAHGLGHLSANCFEAAASNGGPTMQLALTNSACEYVVGDILEADNLSSDATMTFLVDHVHAEHSTFLAAEGFGQVEPGDDGDCMLEVASGAASTTRVWIRDSQLTHCVADGLGVVSNVVDGRGPVKELEFDVERSRISSNSLSNLRVANVTPITRLDGKVEFSDLSRSGGTPIILEGLGTSGGAGAHLDLGGGPLGSAGHDCFYGGTPLSVQIVRYTASARDDWWGQPGGPGPGQIAAVGGGLDAADALAHPPAGVC
jgi:hypothetical protein